MLTKKSFMLASVIMGVVVLGGFGCNNKVSQPETVQDATVVVEDNAMDVTETENDSDGMLSGLQGLLKGGASLKCVSTEEGDEWVTYTNGKNFRGEGMQDGKKQNVLFVDGSMYIWDGASSQGVKMAKNCLEDMQKLAGGESSMSEEDYDFSVETLEADEAAGKVQCTPSTSADFSVPSNITFIDQCALLKEQMEGFALPMQDL